MHFFTLDQYKKLLKNGSPLNSGDDHYPIAKLTVKDCSHKFLITEIDPYDRHFALALSDLGDGKPQYSYINLNLLSDYHHNKKLCIETHPTFIAQYRISIYEAAAKHFEQITEHDALLNRFIDGSYII